MANTGLPEIPILQYLREKNDTYFGKTLELREAIVGWLEYIPHTFPHYTNHTVRHSDEILRQVSSLLFINDDATRPVVGLSGVEAYVIASAAYLHDAGMVVADREKLQLLSSDEWKTWVESSRQAEWDAIQELRASYGSEPDRMFAADLLTRFLLAEYFRRSHHERAGQLVVEEQTKLGRFGFDDPQLVQTIADVCVSHGLDRAVLREDVRYPDRRDLRGEKLNVQFAALLLRLGDLLDLSTDRACPLLLNPASPVPADSIAHWTQYQRIKHRLTAHDRIEVVAECENATEHRVLTDWFAWLSEEVEFGRGLMRGAARHSEWSLPTCTFGDGDSTIVVKPAAEATYIPVDWRIELDADQVLSRLVADTYADPMAAARELIQNALDATRCRVATHVLASQGRRVLDVRTEDAKVLERFPIVVSAASRTIYNEVSEKDEERCVIRVEDLGIGMDEEIVRRYLLQVGRSYYTTEDFRRNYGFVPTSHFGVGFLSVFGVSDHVMVETLREGATDGLRLTLTGPRNYILFEKASRTVTGTTVELILNRALAKGELVKAVQDWCRRVEFPIIVREGGEETVIEAEQAGDLYFRMEDARRSRHFEWRWLPVSDEGVSGEFYHLVVVSDTGEDWTIKTWELDSFLNEHPGARLPTEVGPLTCFHGIRVFSRGRDFPHPLLTPCLRLDYRTERARPTMSREISRRPDSIPPGIARRIESYIEGHLAQAKPTWIYKQRLIDVMPVGLGEWFGKLPGTIRVLKDGREHLASLVQFVEIKSVAVYRQKVHLTEAPDLTNVKRPWLLTTRELRTLSERHSSAFLDGRRVRRVEYGPNEGLLFDFETTSANEAESLMGRQWSVAEFPDSEAMVIAITTTSPSVTAFVANTNHPLIEWMIQLGAVCGSGDYGLIAVDFDRLVRLIERAAQFYSLGVSDLDAALEGWQEYPGLPDSLKPPVLKFSATMVAFP